MEWWKASGLGILVYFLISIILSSLGLVFSFLLLLIPIIGSLLALLLNLAITFSEAVFSGFIAGNLSKDYKLRSGFISGLGGSILESFIRLFIFTIFSGVLGAGAIIYAKVPVELLVGGGFLGSFYFGLIGTLAIIVACFGGYLGAKVSVEMPLSRIQKGIKKRFKF